jgi:aspartyl-tRNA synthetase
MSEPTQHPWRDLMCGEVRPEHVGRRLRLAGWVDTRRDHGGLVFIDLRDRSGRCQLVVNPERAPEAMAAAHGTRNEFVLQAEGEVARRAPEAVNLKLPTGEVELQVDRLEVVSRCPPLPFQLDEEDVDETLRLRYRWLDLRRPKLQRNIALRAQMVGIIRREMEAAGFLDIQTPILFKPTPEGARDFVVPSRLQKGRFYALPQSPQILKQLSMVAGFDRYYQIAICFRDEDLRADRVQEITQLDVEMSFPDQEALFRLVETTMAAIWQECIGVELELPFPRMTHAEADRRFGSDKPDLRFGLELEDATAVTRGSEFGVFAGAEAVRFLRVPRAFSRSELAALEEVAKEWGAKGMAYLVYDETGEVRSPIAKFLSEQELTEFRSDPGTTVLFAADSRAMTSRVLSALRLHLGRELGLVDERAWRWLWVTDFPMFEWDEDAERWGAVHHPFTRPTAEWAGRFHEQPGDALAHAYDLVCNGNELGGGSFRIHEPEIQERVFDLLRLSPDEQRTKFGFLLDALAMGAPPHGGIALGIDRMTMVLAGEENLRDVIAFPKNQAGVDPMSGAPTAVMDDQLDELGIRLKPGLA